jgi:hypothetical protein
MSVFSEFFALFGNDLFSTVLGVFLKTLPIWLPIILFSIFIQVYLEYIRSKWILEQGSVLLELRLPKLMSKSPAAMEVMLGALHQPVVGSYLDVYLKGRVRAWFSLEIVSIEGQVKFFIWTHAKLKNLVEAQVYSQFPNVEVHEVPDYTRDFTYNPSKISLWGAQMRLTKPDPYPIKTYMDYGLDKDPKEEFKIDPMTPMLEFMGSLKRGEQAWVQIMIQAHRKMDLKDAIFPVRKDWKDAAKKEIEKVLKESYIKPEEGKTLKFSDLTEVQKETITAIERSIGKLAFDTMIRAVYIGEKEVYNPVNIGGLMGGFKQYGSSNLNGFAPKWSTGIAYPWEDFRGRRKREKERIIIDSYKRRSFFQPPYKHFEGKPFVLSVEELATIFHLPGEVSATPTLARLVSKKAEAPANLPI